MKLNRWILLIVAQHMYLFMQQQQTNIFYKCNGTYSPFITRLTDYNTCKSVYENSACKDGYDDCKRIYLG